jgi:hypothetical protein
MSSRKILKTAMFGFLGTLTSRYSNYRGYWIYGLLKKELNGLEIDLLAEHVSSAISPIDFFQNFARMKMRDQIIKNNCNISWVKNATLTCSVIGPEYKRYFEEGERSGQDYEIKCNWLTDIGVRKNASVKIFVSQHDPQKERRNSEEHWAKL